MSLLLVSIFQSVFVYFLSTFLSMLLHLCLQPSTCVSICLSLLPVFHMFILACCLYAVRLRFRQSVCMAIFPLS